MNDDAPFDRFVTAALRAMAEDDTADGASRGVEERLLAEVRALRQVRQRAYTKTAAIAAGLALAMALPIARLVDRRAAGEAERVPLDASAPADVELATDFLPLTYSTVPVTGGQIVTLEVPQVALASFGLAAADFADGSPSTVLAEVLVGEDGLARAVRFVRPGAREEQSQ